MDVISDMLTRIRNANIAGHESVEVPSSNLKQEIARILKEEGYILKFDVLTKRNKKFLKIYLKQGAKKPLSVIKSISKPSRRIYVKKDKIPRVLSGFGTAIISTSKGLMTDSEARSLGLGGEVICYIS